MMAQAERHRLGAQAPNNYQIEEGFVLELQYEVDQNNTFTFSYRVAMISPNATYNDRLFINKILAEAEFGPWSDFRPPTVIAHEMDIRINKNSLVIMKTADDQPLFWSLLTDGITTKHDRKNLYFELRYRDGAASVLREDYTQPFCREISFKAKLNHANSTDRRHSFNLNVIANDHLGRPQEIEIDPDIRNPGSP